MLTKFSMRQKILHANQRTGQDVHLHAERQGMHVHVNQEARDKVNIHLRGRRQGVRMSPLSL